VLAGQQRRTVPVPFSFTHRQTRSEKKAEEYRQNDGLHAEPIDPYVGGSAAGAWTERGAPVGARKAFRARDVPRSMSEPRWEMMRVREAERRERVAQEALRSMQCSKLPPRMRQHKETSRARNAAEQERIQAEMDSELTLTPAITGDVPDFDRLHVSFEKELARKRQQFKSTRPLPFKMESEPYRLMQREVKQVRDEMIQRDIRRDELVMPERRWPYLSTQAPIGRKDMPNFSKEHSTCRAKAPNAETTEKNNAMLEKRREESRAQKKQEDGKKKADEARQAAQKEITLKVSNRLKEVAGDPKNIKQKAKEEAQRRKEEHRQAWKDRKATVAASMAEMRARVESRPFLFEQSTIDAAVERAKAEAHERFDSTLRKHGLADRLDTAAT